MNKTEKSRSVLVSGRFRSAVLTGLVVLIPIMLTAWVVKWITMKITFIMRGLLFIIPMPPKIHAMLEDPVVYALAIIVAFLLTLLGLAVMGTVAQNVLGRRIILFFEKMMNRLPIVNKIYGTFNQIIRTVFGQSHFLFQKAVYFEYPRKGIWTLGFMTGRAAPECEHHCGKKMINIFVSTTPNPTSGYLAIIPEDEVIYLDMSVEEALKLILSGGIVVPPYESSGGRTINDSKNMKIDRPAST